MAPPILSRHGSRRKLKLGSWLTPLLRMLARLRRIRGTPLDPFRYTRDRKLAERLRAAYEEDADFIAAHLGERNLAAALELAQWPDAVKGFGFIKEQAAEAAMSRRDELRDALLRASVGRAA